MSPNANGVPTPNQSPRSRRASRPLAFSLIGAMPPPSSFPPPPTTMTTTPFQLYEPTPSLPSRPQSPSFHRTAVIDLHAALYGNRDRAAISTLVWDMYDTNAVFENPVTYARGQAQIVDLFALLGVVPGEMWSELGDICESQSYGESFDGSRLVTMSHTLHYRLLGSPTPVDPASISAEFRASDSFYSYASSPATPFLSHPLPAVPALEPTTASYSPTLHTVSEEGRWPLSHVFRTLRPRNIIDKLSTVSVKLYSRLEFNETGRISRHEDVIGIRETIEGVFPVLGHLYSLNRQGAGFLASTASRLLLRPKAPDPESAVAATREAPTFRRTASTIFANRHGSGYGNRHSRTSSRDFVGPAPVHKEDFGGALANGLGLEDLEEPSFLPSVDPYQSE